MKNNKPEIKRKPAMSNVEVLLLILYMASGFFMMIAAEYHIGCYPGRVRDGAVPMCSSDCYLGFDITRFQPRDKHMKIEAAPLMPCWPFDNVN
jgi:hypothetical protein